MLAKFEEYENDTIDGLHGKTAQYYAIYVRMIDNYLLLTRSIRTGDFDLFKFVIPKIADLFFALNQQNYSRFLVLYHDALCRVDESHPGLETSLRRGSFGSKRTNKPFSRQPIDLTMEQTYNADAARHLSGVAHFTNSISARQRWSKSHGIRSSIISYVFDKAGLNKKQDVSAELERNKIKSSIQQRDKFLEAMKSTLNPFSTELDKDSLFNIKTGRAAPEHVSDFLLKVLKEGKELREKFIGECFESSDRFEKAIKKREIFNFASISIKRKLTVGNKVQEIRMQRDTFGRLLALSMNPDFKLDLAKALSYPITPLPMSLCHFDDTICKTSKSSLMNLLAAEVKSEGPPYEDIVLLDGFFILHLMKDVPKLFENIAKKILQTITKYKAHRIDVLFDRYMHPSIKDYEHGLRQACSNNYVIAGPEQARPTDFMKELQNNNFKEALVQFLIQHWASDEFVPYIGNKSVNINYDFCYNYKTESNKVVRTVDYHLSCQSHEEADTKIIYHVSKINDASNILIRCSDTDVLVILLGNMMHFEVCHKIWMEVGVGNSQRYVDVSKLYMKLGISLSRALPGFHAFTGCDYNPSFFRKGKNKPFKLLKSFEDYQRAFGDLGDRDVETSTVFPVIEEFVCRMYSVKHVDTVNEARLELFNENYKADNPKDIFAKKIRNFDASNLPPCSTELQQQLMRSLYIASIWQNANLQQPTEKLPENHGWCINENKYDFRWFDGDQLPQFIDDILQDTSCVSSQHADSESGMQISQ